MYRYLAPPPLALDQSDKQLRLMPSNFSSGVGRRLGMAWCKKASIGRGRALAMHGGLFSQGCARPWHATCHDFPMREVTQPLTSCSY